jgi:Fic family protein
MHVAVPPRLTLDEMTPDKLAHLLNCPVDGHGYLHWDKLRQLDSPEGYTHREWWFRLKLSRQLRELPFRDAHGQPFSYGLPDELLRLLHFVDQHCSGEIKMAEVVTADAQAREHYLVNSLMEEAIRSSQLEGATTSRRVAKELLRSGRSPVNRSERMILNNYRALQFMHDEMGAELKPRLVLELHRLLTEGTLDDPSAAGRLQRADESRVAVHDRLDDSVLHAPPPAEQLPARLEALCDFANADDSTDGNAPFVHPVVRAILLHFALAYDHPFVDGNGRTARALFYWYLRARGYWLVEYLSISRILREAPARYNRAFLLTETDDGDTTYFLLHQLRTIRRAVEELQRYLARKAREIQFVEQLLHDAPGFNHRQLALLGDALRHRDRTYTYGGHAKSHRVTHETARTDIARLMDLGFLDPIRIGRRHVFRVPPDLADRLRAFGSSIPPHVRLSAKASW